MTPAEVAAILRQFNEWRRSDYEPSEQPAPPDPREIGEAIDSAIEMIDRLEATEADGLEQARLNGMSAEREAALLAKLEAADRERDALRAKIEAMAKQEPVGGAGAMPGTSGFTMACFRADAVPFGSKLYALPGAHAQPTPSDEYVGWYCAHCQRGVAASEVTYHEQHEVCGRVITDDRPPKPEAQPTPTKQDASVRKAWARFSHELHRSPDAPYPGMADAFEQHFSQSFTDREWMAEASTWAAAWKAAKRHGAQSTPSVNEGVRKVTLGFRWESEAQHHIPTIEIEFDPVSPESPNDAKGWQDRDRIASRLSPEAKP